MYFADIIDEASEISGLCKEDPGLYRLATRAIQTLSKKGNWDSLQFYLDIFVQSGNLVTLPREVETPLKININRQPAFSRSRLYEFSLNGPGGDDRQFIGFQWMDRVRVPIMGDLTALGNTITVTSDPADDGKIIRLFGIDPNNDEVNDSLTLNSATPPVTANLYRHVRRVRKDITVKRVQLMLDADTMIANYYPDETEPKYRQIRLSKKATFVHILFRRNTYAITSAEDYIPLDSEQAVLMMIRALHKYNNSDTGFQDAEALENQAVKFLKEDQDIRNSFIAMAQADEKAPILNLNINNRDTIIVGDIYDEASDIFGPIGRNKLFDKITEAKELLNRKYPMWKGTEGYVDICTNWQRVVTLPRYVEIPIAINIGGRPLTMRNRWFEFHPNGPGSNCETSCRHWDDLDISVTVNDPPKAQRLVAINDLAEDDGACVRIYGYDDKGKWLRTPNNDVDDEDNKWVDGIQLVARAGNVIPAKGTHKIKRITRITRDETQGYQSLLAYDDNNSVATLIGYYYPDETEPSYARIKLPVMAPWIRMRYRTRWLKFRSLTDPLHLRSRTAILHALRSLRALIGEKADPASARAFEEMAYNDLREQENAEKPAETFNFSFEHGSLADPMQGQY